MKSWIEKVDIKSGLKWVSLWLVLFAVLSVVVDYVRQPEQLHHVDVSQSVSTLTGKTVTLSQQEKPTLVYFWGTWCSVCKHTSPQLQRFAQNSDFQVVTVAMDSGSDAKVSTYLRKHKLDFATVNDVDNVLSRQWGVQVVPTIVVVNDGKVRQTFTGFNSYPMMRLKIWLAQVLG